MDDSNETKQEPLAENSELPANPACSALESGEICPVCGKGRMAYDGFLVLTCPECGYKMGGGGFT